MVAVTLAHTGEGSCDGESTQVDLPQTTVGTLPHASVRLLSVVGGLNLLSARKHDESCILLYAFKNCSVCSVHGLERNSVILVLFYT